ncbi:ROK family protein [Patescibacteria group bacterium]|nr:ROK family protein [Patescibacteria group bacterium]
MLKKHILGIDLGGTFTKFGLVNAGSVLLKFEEVPTPENKEKIIDLLIKKIRLYQADISKIGIGIPGIVNSKDGKILTTPNLPLSNFSLLRFLKEKIKLPIKIENDVNCFTLAEALIGSARAYQNVIGLTLGTGIGGGIVINKKIYHGHGYAGEFGHQFIDYKNNKDLEDLLGAKKLKLEGFDYKKLAKDALSKKVVALNFWKNLGNVLGYGCLNLIHLFDPEIIVLGGKQTQFFNLFYPSLIKTVKKHCLVPLPKITKSRLIDKAGVIGACLLFKK